MTIQTPALPPLYFSPPNEGEATATAAEEERAAPPSSLLLSILPPELLHSCLARYADWGDLARLACVQSKWRDVVDDAATFGGRDATWELSMCLLHGDDGRGNGRRTTPQGEEDGKQRRILANGEECGEDAGNNDNDDDDDDDDDDDARTGNNRGLEKNEALAVKYLTRLCGVVEVESGEQPHPSGERGGQAVITGSVLPGDEESSSAGHHVAADGAALLELASCYLSGVGLPRPDPASAVRCLTSAYHRAGSVESAHRLALLYEYPDRSDGLVPIDVVAAFEWFRAAAVNGHVESMAELALCYELGCGVDRSDEEALDWYTKAANAGHSASHYSVGEHFEEARGVNMDHEEACLWYYRAAVLGEEDGVGGLRRLADVARRVVPQAEEVLNNHA